MSKPYEYVTDLFHKIREDLTQIKHRLFTEKPKLESSEHPLEYSIDAIHKRNDTEKETAPPQGPMIRARLNLPETIAVKAETEERKKPWKQDRNFLVEIAAIFVGAIVALIYGCQLWQMIEANRISQTTFYSINRPFIGYDGTSVRHIARDTKTNSNVLSPVRTDKTQELQFEAHIKNAGSLPGTNFTGHWRVFLNGIEQSSLNLPGAPYTLFQGQVVALSGVIGIRDYPQVMAGTEILSIKVYVSYDGPKNHYEECREEQYNQDVNGFLNIGGCPVT
jgi:hypothetical protein